jgi:hypothetical protein
MKKVHIGLWFLIILNLILGLLFRFAPESFPMSIEHVIVSFLPKEDSILETKYRGLVPNISLSGQVQGASEIVTRDP